MTESIDVHAIILAAGGSSRLGHPKQLVQVGENSLLQRAVQIALGADPASVIVVTGAHEQAMLTELIGQNVCIVHNSNWQDGMGSSIRCGMHALRDVPEPFGALFLLCDQLEVTALHLRKMISAFREGRAMVASGYSGIAGVPALFASTFREELASLDGAHGAKQLLARHAEKVHIVPLPGGERDVDTPADLERLAPPSMPSKRP